MKNKLFILLFCLLGSIVRFYFGYNIQPWLHAPDQLAWEVVLQNGNWTYSHLIHYPHEGGSIIISFIAHFVQLFTSFHSLTIVAFLLDFIVRFIQLFVVSQLFNRKILYFFASWTIFALPFIIPWGTVNFGLHLITSVFPFIYIWLYHYKKANDLVIGVFLGLAFWFHYANLILIIIYLVSNLFKRNSIKKWGVALLSITIIIGLHIITRLYFDAGFQLEKTEGTSIRGTEFVWDELLTYKRIYLLWFNPLSNSILTGVNSEDVFPWTAHLWTTCLIMGSLLLLIKKDSDRKILLPSLAIVALFFIIYAISPFYWDEDKISNYVLYRHLCIIVPFAVLLAIIGLSKIKITSHLIYVFILSGSLNSILSFKQSPIKTAAIRPTGWVIATKFGHDPNVIIQFAEKTDLNKEEFMEGVGWGTASALFRYTKNQDEALPIFDSLYHEYPPKFQQSFLKGVEFAFSDHVNPKLDKKIKTRINLFKDQ